MMEPVGKVHLGPDELDLLETAGMKARMVPTPKVEATQIVCRQERFQTSLAQSDSFVELINVDNAARPSAQAYARQRRNRGCIYARIASNTMIYLVEINANKHEIVMILSWKLLPREVLSHHNLIMCE